VREPRGYQGPTALIGLQQRLVRRWAGGGVHPHEALTGLLTLVHDASNEELRGLTTGDIDAAARSVRLGRRPQPVPLDPATWAAVERCLRYHRDLGTANPGRGITGLYLAGHVDDARLHGTDQTAPAVADSWPLAAPERLSGDNQNRTKRDRQS